MSRLMLLARRLAALAGVASAATLALSDALAAQAVPPAAASAPAPVATPAAPPAAVPPLTGRITGVGGIFFRSRNPQALMAWYRDTLGLKVEDWGGVVMSYDAPRHPPAVTLTAFTEKSTMMAPSRREFMINFAVDDLDAFLARIKAKGVTVLKRDDGDPYGRFAWILDPTGPRSNSTSPSKVSRPGDGSAVAPGRQGIRRSVERAAREGAHDDRQTEEKLGDHARHGLHDAWCDGGIRPASVKEPSGPPAAAASSHASVAAFHRSAVPAPATLGRDALDLAG